MKTVSRALVLLSCLATTSVGAEDAAKQRLDALIASYKALPAYADHGEVTLVVKVGERTLKQVSQASLSFSKPNKLDVRTEFVRIVSDGATLTTVVVPLKKFQTTAVPRKFTEAALRGGPLGAIEFGGVAGLPIVHVLNLVIGDNPARLIEDFAPKLLAEPDMMVEGTSYQVLRLDEADNDDWRFLIDPKTGLLAFVDLVIEGDATKSSIAGSDTHVDSLRWSAGAVSTTVPKDEAFGFTAPEGFTGVAKLEGAVARVADSHPLVGKPAPDFTIDAFDGPGKFRKVSKADLAGKVVLLDFWATWCGPCLTEMPDVQVLIEAYGKAKKDVVVVALSIDQVETGDLAEARNTVESTLKQKRLILMPEGNPVGLVAVDPLQRVAEAFGVKAIPFVVLIDTQGIIRAVHVGVTTKDVFEEEIDGLLYPKQAGNGAK